MNVAINTVQTFIQVLKSAPMIYYRYRLRNVAEKLYEGYSWADALPLEFLFATLILLCGDPDPFESRMGVLQERMEPFWNRCVNESPPVLDSIKLVR